MPYPVLPPPPPPIVSNEVSLQSPELEMMASDHAPMLRGEGHHRVDGGPSSVEWESCLASPERLPSESSSTTGDRTGNSAVSGNGPSQFFCIPSQHHSLSLLPLSPRGLTPHSSSDVYQASHLSSAVQADRPHKGDRTAGINVSAGTLPAGTEIVDELHFVLDTFNADELQPPDLRQLAHQPGEPAPDIFIIPLQTSTPLMPQLLSQNVTETPIPAILDPDTIPSVDRPDSLPINIEVLETGIEALSNEGSSVPLEIDGDSLPPDGEGIDLPDVDGTDLPNTELPSIDDLPESLPDVDPSTIDPSTIDPSTIDPSTIDPSTVDDALDTGSDVLEEILPETEETDRPSLPNVQDPQPQDDVLDDSAESTGEDALEVTADRQVYDRNRQYFLAEGNALMTFRGALLRADTLRVNLVNQVVVAEGNAVLTRGDQVIRGNRLEYNLVQDQGTIYDAKGEVFLPQTSSDFGPNRPDTLDTSSDVPLTDRLATDQPVVTASSPGGLSLGVRVSGEQSSNAAREGSTGGTVSRIRFESDEITFNPDGWEATNVRLTNDPFSPPELEIRSRLVTFRRLDANRSELRARNPRLVLDQGLQIPLLRERAIFDRRDRNPAPFQISFDEEERGGLFIQRPFTPIATPNVLLTLTPQFFLQQAIENDDGTDETPPDLDDSSSWLDPDLYGLLGELDVQLGSKTSLVGNMTLTSLDFGDDVSEDDLRGSVRLRRKINTGLGPHTLTSEYSYRDRLFNGTLGFQTIQKSYGIVLTSPPISLGDTGIQLTYQGGIQRVNANIASDRINDLLPPPPRPNNRDTLTRYQVAADLSRTYFLWKGTTLPATQDEGLRYTPNPVLPYIALRPSVRGVASFYSSGDDQPILTGQLSLLGQFGHFSRPYLDYLGFNLTYRRSTDGSESPFNFDRVADREVLSGGITAQLFGPIRVGFKTSISLDEDEEFDNSFILEYSRRTHGLIVQYNPDRQIGTIGLRISDFNWNGTPEPFGGSGVRTVNDGVLRND